MYYGEIKYPDVANGPGVRVSVFVSGCDLHCIGCFNSNTWSFDYGQRWTERDKQRVLAIGEGEYVSGLTVLGGEPLHPRSIPDVADLIDSWASLCAKPVWCYTGYRFEVIQRFAKDPEYKKYLDMILPNLEVLVDGPFIQKKKDPSLRFRGSSNQRLIDIPKTLSTGSVVLFE